MEARFTDMGRKCLGDRFKLKSKGSAVPSDILAWNAIKGHLEGRAATYPITSMSMVLAQPITFVDKVATPFGPPLTVTWPALLPPTMQGGMSDGRRVQNCSALVSGNADLKVDLPIVRAALEASHSTKTATINYLYSGRIVSPFAWAIAGGGSPDSTPPMSRFTVLLGIWDWYRKNPSTATRKDIAVRNLVDGLALYSVEGVTQDTLLSGDADVRFGLPFLGGSASSRGQVGYHVSGDVNDYASVIFADVTYQWLPGAAQIADLAQRLTQVQPAADNPTAIDGKPFVYGIVVKDVPSSMCDGSVWSPTSPVTSFTVQPGADGSCRFQGLVTPDKDADATFTVAFGVESVVAAPTAVRLILAATPASLTDERALLSLNVMQAPTVTLPPAGGVEPVNIAMNFAVIEQGDASALNLSRNESSLKLSCGGRVVSNLSIERYPISRDASEQASLLLSVQAPATAFTAATSDAATRCQVDGTLSVRRRLRGTIGTQFIRLPSVAFDVVRRPTAVPASAAAGPAPADTL